MLVTRRAVLASTAAALLVRGQARADSVTDDSGRAVPVPDKVTRVFPAGPPAAIMLYTLAPELLLGWPRANRPEECAYMLPDICARPEIGRITGRGNTANLESGDRAQARSHPRCRLDQRHLRFAGRTGAAADRHSLRAARRPFSLAVDHATEKLGKLIGARGRRRRLRRLLQHDARRHHQPHRLRTARQTPARLLRARAARAGDRARRLDQRRDHRIAWRANVAGGNARRARQCFDRAGAAVEPGRDRHHRPGFRRERAQRSGLGLGRSGARTAACICRRKCRSAGSISRPR